MTMRPDFLLKKPHFFKIIHPSLLRDGKPGIPMRFLSEYGKYLSSCIFLKVPPGAEWRVELMKCDGEVWLQGGWQEFAEYYCIGYGHFLVFRYEGNSNFHVLIFDMTATEIQYPSIIATLDEETNSNNLECRKSDLQILENDVSIEILDDYVARKTIKEENLIDSPPRPTTKRCKVSEIVPPVTASKKSGALERAKSFLPKNPFFLVTMRPSYIRGGDLNIPVNFARRHLTTDNGNAKLWVSEGRSWGVSYRKYGSRAKISSGWGKFMRDNCLRLGDVCGFELLKSKSTSTLLRVVIFRNNDHATFHLPLPN